MVAEVVVVEEVEVEDEEVGGFEEKEQHVQVFVGQLGHARVDGQ